MRRARLTPLIICLPEMAPPDVKLNTHPQHGAAHCPALLTRPSGAAASQVAAAYVQLHAQSPTSTGTATGRAAAPGNSLAPAAKGPPAAAGHINDAVAAAGSAAPMSPRVPGLSSLTRAKGAAAAAGMLIVGGPPVGRPSMAGRAAHGPLVMGPVPDVGAVWELAQATVCQAALGTYQVGAGAVGTRGARRAGQSQRALSWEGTTCQGW